MPGYELIGKEEKEQLIDIFETSNGVLFPHGFDNLRNGRYRVREFENEFSRKFNCQYTQAVTSGTVAQLVAMLAMGVKAGDEVITQAHTFVATVESILAIGAIPVIVNVDDTYNMDPLEFENAITANTKLIVPVHMLGNPASMNEIMGIANKYKIPVLEDGCEALGATYNGKYVGTIGDAGIFSLDFAKTITTGEGGLIVTGNQSIYKYAKEYHDHGHESNPAFPRGRDTRSIAGMNYRMTEMQGGVGIAQLKRLDFIVKKSKEHKSFLKQNIDKNKISYRKITDEIGDLGDTLIFNFEQAKFAEKFLNGYKTAGYSTKNIPDAIDWHFAGTWNHMFTNVKAYRDNWKTQWHRTAKLLNRSIAIPIYVNTTQPELNKQLDTINLLMQTI
ncbi:MAG: DegT/DnrJ/EryC1/StrS family aminotransferase [Bacteroidia bacterium]|nr:DegT/DnrJ/EryC1/StrS family aminotransferase [Bacteroidia bacterium]